MRTVNDGVLTTKQVCDILGIHRQTLARWYNWWENKYFEKPDDLYLPGYFFVNGVKQKHFYPKDIPALKKFQEQVNTTHRGCMSRYNAAKVWGPRGDSKLRREGLDPTEERAKLYDNYVED